MRFKLSPKFRILPYLVALFLAITAATITFASRVRFGFSDLLEWVFKFFNPQTTSTATTIYEHIQDFLACMFYVSIGLIAISVIILAIDFFQKKEEETIRTGITTVIDFAKMTPEQIAQFMDRVKDMSSAQIETLLGGQYAKTIKEAKRHTGGKATKISSKTKKEGKKGRKA